MEPPCRILFGDICVPHGTHSCSRPALQQTSLQRQFSLILDLVTFPFVQKYECALRHMTSIRSLHNCKLVCIASAYIRLHSACRIYCSRLGRAAPGCCFITLFGDICVPFGTQSCSRPVRLQTSLRCTDLSHLSLRFLYLQIEGANIFALLSASAYICTSKMLCDESRGFYF